MSAPSWIKTVRTQSVTSETATMNHTRQITVITNAGRVSSQKRHEGMSL